MTVGIRRPHRGWWWLLLCILAWGCGQAIGQEPRQGEAAVARGPEPLALDVGLQLEPPVLDPTAGASTALAEVVYGNLFENLVRLDGRAEPQPWLARSWAVSPDGLHWRFALQPGVRFHDGRAFDAEAAQTVLQRALQAGSTNPQKSLLAGVVQVAAEGALTLRLDLQRPDGGLLQALAMPAFAMVSPSAGVGNATRPVGTGPFRFADWRRGDLIRLERFAGYWGTPVRLDVLRFHFIGDPSAAYAALMAGDVQLFPNFPAPENIAQFQADPRFAVQVGLTEGEVTLGINHRQGPLADRRVRLALVYALDRPALIAGAMDGFGQPIGAAFSPRHPDAVDLSQRYPHDPVRARALLAEAGYPHGLSLTLKLPPPAYARRSGEVLVSQFAQAGIRLQLVNLEWAQWVAQVFLQHDFELTLVAHAEPLDYDIYGRDDYYFGPALPPLKATLAALGQAGDPAARHALFVKLQEQMADEAVNGYLFQYPKLSVADRRVQGLRQGGLVDSADLSGVWLTAPVTQEGPPTVLARGVLPVLGAAVGLLATGLLLLAWRQQGPLWMLQWAAVLALTLWAASLLVFAVVQVVPGDPVRQMMGLQAEPAAVEAVRAQLGLGGPVVLRYLHWVRGMLQGDLGVSYTYRVPVQDLVGERLSLSLPLAVYALSLATVLAVPVALAAVRWRGRALGGTLQALVQLGVAIPNFWLGVLLTLVFAVGLRWVSAGGFPGWSGGFTPALIALTLPALALALPQAAILARVLRAALLDTLHEPWMRTARAKGLSATQALWRHGLPNALVPVLTLLGMQFAFLLAGGVIIENVFFLPGLGRLVLQAIVQRDLIVVQGVVMVLVLAVVGVSFLVDLAYGAVDPRLHRRTSA